MSWLNCFAMNGLSKRFLCCFPLRDIQIEDVLNNISWDEQEVLLRNTALHPLLINKPINISYQAAFLKKIIDYLSDAQIEIHDDVYSTYCALIQKGKEKNNFHYKHYKVLNDDSCIVTLKENLNLISNGTTGLRTWEASMVLSEWCIQNSESLTNKSVLELGAGAGLTGIIVFKFSKLKSMWMSDCHELVINLLKENVLLNYDKKLCVDSKDVVLKLSQDSKELGIVNLLWEDVENFPKLNISYPDIVIAADVLYDASIFNGLLKSFVYFLNAKENCEILLVSTIRNQETIDTFMKLLAENNLQFEKIPNPAPLHLCWAPTANVVIYKITNR